MHVINGYLFAVFEPGYVVTGLGNLTASEFERFKKLQILKPATIVEDMNNKNRKTSVDIIREVKTLLNYEGLKAVSTTKRPETPLEENRKLLLRKCSANELMTTASASGATNSGDNFEFNFESRPSSAAIRLAPLNIDKTRSLSAGKPKSATLSKSRLKQPHQKNISALKPLEAFHNLPANANEINISNNHSELLSFFYLQNNNNNKNGDNNDTDKMSKKKKKLYSKNEDFDDDEGDDEILAFVESIKTSQKSEL
ncbi:hypothetical protein HELRODRAFT_179250 [Helobdella robusta]|uniref:Uncharacterized protein n=1 Tax=Helobdella robusta TaxID=6412 RepID=T1FEF6_HELRO|nr:hypothetical protein HELRODRAFT_179250 [Helobdella robusta]ESN95481.1 hypothetical protein HELRODRAFT_179250 [Helobdella robusta]